MLRSDCMHGGQKAGAAVQMGRSKPGKVCARLLGFWSMCEKRDEVGAGVRAANGR